MFHQLLVGLGAKNRNFENQLQPTKKSEKSKKSKKIDFFFKVENAFQKAQLTPKTDPQSGCGLPWGPPEVISNFIFLDFL